MSAFIPRGFYGVINYVTALVSMASPWLFGFEDYRGAAFFLPILIGWVQLIMAIFSNNSHGFIKIFPMPTHNVLDAFSGFILLVSPFLYGFAFVENGIFWPHVLIGGTFFIAGVFTHGSPFTTDDVHHEVVNN
ncbi:hypothetical protein ACFQZS_11980 [Mucilaginibacter calamicampi]|uniref:SPW repeat-containing integral membrane domain-containing protein n=1 Tax=Mucilaginibacter calamicampi TaxID=1302352 RepID=A0ABW2YZ44_9SPHI